MRLLHNLSIPAIQEAFYCDRQTASKIRRIATTTYTEEGGIYDALEALDYALWRRGVVHTGRYSYVNHGYLAEEPTIIADHDFKSRGFMGSRYGALFLGYAKEIGQRV